MECTVPSASEAYEYALRTPSPRRPSAARGSASEAQHAEAPVEGQHAEVPSWESVPPPSTPRCPWPSPLTPPRTPLKQLQFCEYSDRLIPSRAGSNLETGFDWLTENGPPNASTATTSAKGDGDPAAFARLLRSELLGLSSPASVGTERDERSLRTPERGLFRYKSQAEEAETALLSASTCLETPRKVARRFPSAPYKVLSAPGLEDDYYLNLLDWSLDDNLAVGLGRDVDLWNASSGRATRLCELETPVCSLRWSRRSPHLALGLADGDVQIWDIAVGARLQNLQGHRRRTCALVWADGELFSGSQDTSILRWDPREGNGRPTQRLAGHTEEVCGLSWSDDLQLLASGGNEGQVYLWSPAQPLAAARRLGCHTAACKALEWSPRGALLATGGGTADRTIRLWNASTGTQTSMVETDSQVCNLAWSQDGELVSTHGFSTCEINVWKSQGGLSRLHVFQWHQARVLYMAMSPDRQSAVVGTGNEMLCFWHLAPKGPKASLTPGSSCSATISEGSSLSRTIR
ncbi:unnamed protein product [Durusdinium trenchii]|uniref:CDC20/Fizzy WD40 domain-containing protein n=1 Tax=Durusdinium trenchii TaxID=1381693 RepID=A0ABP0NUI8_9DINO